VPQAERGAAGTGPDREWCGHDAAAPKRRPPRGRGSDGNTRPDQSTDGGDSRSRFIPPQWPGPGDVEHREPDQYSYAQHCAAA